MRNQPTPLRYLVLIGALTSACNASPATQTPSTGPTQTAPPPTVTREGESTTTPTQSAPDDTLPPSRVDAFEVEMSLIPEGIFLMGTEDGESNEGPSHAVYTDAVYMDTFEVTNSQYQDCVEDGACPQPRLIEDYQTNPDFADYPAVNVSWDMANTYCAWRGGRLPTEAEWEKAARWDPITDELRTYPWGEEPTQSYHANIITEGRSIGGTTRVGSYERGVSALGLYDMGGNVWEWVSDFYAEGYYANSPGKNPTGPEQDTGYRILRGGGWNDADYYARTTARVAVGPATAGPWSGVRCAKEP